MPIMYFQVSIVEYSVYVLVFRTSNNFLYSRQFSHLAKVFGWKIVVLIISMWGIKHIYIDGLVGWLSCLIVKTVVFLITHHF